MTTASARFAVRALVLATIVQMAAPVCGRLEVLESTVSAALVGRRGLSSSDLDAAIDELLDAGSLGSTMAQDGARVVAALYVA